MAQTMAQYAVEQARLEARAEGEMRGIEIGQERQARRALLTVLTTRFGELPAAIIQSIEAADSRQLDNWFAVALTAVSLEAVGIETQH